VPRARLLSAFVPVALVAAGGAMLLGLACGSTSTETLFPPITGVTVKAESLTSGRGCGTGATQIFKYVVVVSTPVPNTTDASPPPPPVYAASNLYDCFTDGTFVDLPDIGIAQYDIKVYAYSRAAFTAAGADTIATIVNRMNRNRALILTDAGGANELSAIAADLVLLRNTNPTYSTTCSASQLELVQSLAACKPLQLGTNGLDTNPDGGTAAATVVLPLAHFDQKGSATGVTCDDQYVTVRTTVRVGTGAASAPTDTRCSGLGDAGLTSSTVTIAPAEAPASYAFTATLLRADGTTLGATTCAAETSPGLTSTAVCQPLP
jgi:hypothetical protein